MSNPSLTRSRKAYFAAVRKIAAEHGISFAEAKVFYKSGNGTAPASQQMAIGDNRSQVKRRIDAAHALVTECGGDLDLAAELIETMQILSN